MTNEEHDISLLAGLDSSDGQDSKNTILNTEISRLEVEIVHLSSLLVAHKDCCIASQVCTHSMHLGPPQNAPKCNIAKTRTIPKVTDSYC
jgi:hypothetical protein